MKSIHLIQAILYFDSSNYNWFNMKTVKRCNFVVNNIFMNLLLAEKKKFVNQTNRERGWCNDSHTFDLKISWPCRVISQFKYERYKTIDGISYIVGKYIVEETYQCWMNAWGGIYRSFSIEKKENEFIFITLYRGVLCRIPFTLACSKQIYEIILQYFGMVYKRDKKRNLNFFQYPFSRSKHEQFFFQRIY